MAINFPATPTLGQVILVGNKAYAWNGKGWEIPTSPAGGGGGGGASVTTDDNPPAIPKDGDMWLKTTTGVLYVYYDDGNSQQWIQVAASPQIVGKKNTANRYNMVINGALNVSQQNGDTEGTTPGYYAADQMTMEPGGSSLSVGFSRVAVANLSGSQYRMQLRVITPKASLGTGDIAGMLTKIEGLNALDLGWISAGSQKDAVLTFGFKGPAGTYCASINNQAGTHAFIAPFTITAGQAGADTLQTIKVPAPAGMTTWNTDNSASIYLHIVLAAGTAVQAAAGWQSSSAVGVTGMTNGVGVAQTFQIWDIGLYADPDKTAVAPPFEIEDYGAALYKCQRYWQRFLIRYSGNVGSASVYTASGYLNQIMRTQPTRSGVASGTPVSFPNAVGTIGGADFTTSFTNVYEQRTANATANGAFATVATFDARM